MFKTGTASGRRKRLVVLAAIVIGLWACGERLSRTATRLFVSVDTEELKSDLKASLPIGSSLNAGTEWFARHGVEPTVEGYGSCSMFGAIPADTLFETGETRVRLVYDALQLKSVQVERHMQPRWVLWQGRQNGSQP
jgi:hypothetical protein